MDTVEQLLESSPIIETQIGYTFHNKSLLVTAFTHRSFLNEHRHSSLEHNERLEFLGDAILDFFIADYLYTILPLMPEGELSRLRSRLVEASSCLLYIQKLKVESYLLLGKGERMNDGRGRDSILSDLFEAIIGAIYLDGGLETAKQFLFNHFQEEIQTMIQQPKHNWKAQLQDYAQRKYQQTPIYEVVEAIGPDHSKNFTISVFINGEELGFGQGPSKKEAQQAAAEDALNRLKSTNIP